MAFYSNQGAASSISRHRRSGGRSVSQDELITALPPNPFIETTRSLAPFNLDRRGRSRNKGQRNPLSSVPFSTMRISEAISNEPTSPAPRSNTFPDKAEHEDEHEDEADDHDDANDQDDNNPLPFPPPSPNTRHMATFSTM